MSKLTPQAKYEKEKMLQVKAKYNTEFVLEFKKAAKFLNLKQSDLIRNVMKETIQKYQEELTMNKLNELTEDQVMELSYKELCSLKDFSGGSWEIKSISFSDGQSHVSKANATATIEETLDYDGGSVTVRYEATDEECTGTQNNAYLRSKNKEEVDYDEMAEDAASWTEFFDNDTHYMSDYQIISIDKN